MKLAEVLRNVDIEGNKPAGDFEITGIAYDSRKVEPGFLFVAIDGVEDDGHKYIGKAWNNGAVAAIVTKEVEARGNIVVFTSDARIALAQASANFYNNPSKDMDLMGITGTKGKTTTTFMVKSILDKAFGNCGIIGSLGIHYKDTHITTSQNTPQSSDLQKMLRDIADSGVRRCIMEVTSTGLKQYRTGCTEYSIGMFTNISRAHIGKREHPDFDDYLKSKAMLFSICKKAIINIDDDHSDYIMNAAKCPVVTLAVEKEADVMAIDIKMRGDGSVFTYKGLGHEFKIRLELPGMFNVYNALFAATAALLSGADENHIVSGIGDVVVPGRCEKQDIDTEYSVIIDYAHSPDSLEKFLEAMTEFAEGRVISVFGCGGDRDATMRPMMGEISGRLADFTIITSDNPRFEEPAKIISQIEEGMKKTGGEYICIEDRTEAIEYAMRNAKKDDLIILAGKGHETYLDRMGKKTHYDEREIVLEVLDRIRSKS
jgi:UDP-N-acetylmuramoyl-L-alanyl-D-glutamate--2,6-diaminopimelate ligase